MIDIDNPDTGTPCCGAGCREAHDNTLDDVDTEIAVWRFRSERWKASAKSLDAKLTEARQALEYILNGLTVGRDLVAEGLLDQTPWLDSMREAARAALSDAPGSREERLAALGFEHPKPGSGTVGELIGLKPVEEAPAPLWLDDWPEEEETEHLAALRRHTKGGGNG
jgi:hypothetical protein